MARKRRYRFIVDPTLKAAAVVGAAVTKFATKHKELAEHYETGITGYASDVNKQLWALVKLAGYYEGLQRPEVRNAISDAIKKAKETQTEYVASVEPHLPPAIPANVAERAKTLTEKLKQLLGVTAAPTAAPAA